MAGDRVLIGSVSGNFPENREFFRDSRPKLNKDVVEPRENGQKSTEYPVLNQGTLVGEQAIFTLASGNLACSLSDENTAVTV